MPAPAGSRLGVLRIDPAWVPIGSAIFGDCKGDVRSSSADSFRCSAIIGGRSGVLASSCRSAASFGSGSSISRGRWDLEIARGRLEGLNSG